MKSSIFSVAFATLALSSAASAVGLVGVTGDNQLSFFDSSSPDTFTSQTPITGLVGSDGTTADPFGTILNLGYDYSNSRLVGIDGNANIYTVGFDGNATLLNSSFSPNGFDAGFAYDPFNQSFIYADDTGEYYSVSGDGSTSSEGTLEYAGATVTPSIFGVGIDPDFGEAFFLDAQNDSLSQAVSADFSEQFIIGELGTDVTSFGGMVVDGQGNLFASMSTDGLASELYSINPDSGEASLIGSFSGDSGVSTIAVPEPTTGLLALLSLLPMFSRRRTR